jgi:pimeloyl-ACP methyl ester carboxylesterase
MPYAFNSIDGGRIYYESSGLGSPLILHQGFMRTTAECHDAGYVDLFSEEYRVILIDSRGHGRTDGPHDPSAYTGEILAEDVISVLDDLGIDKTHFVGYSSGGRTGYAVHEHYPERLLTLTIGGKDVLPLAPGYLDSTIEALENGIEEFINTREQMAGKPYTAERRARFASLDAEALRYLCITYMYEGISGLENAIENVTMPCLLYAGTEDAIFDNVKKTAEMIPGSEFSALPDLNHGEAWENIGVVIPVISDFLSRHR